MRSAWICNGAQRLGGRSLQWRSTIDQLLVSLFSVSAEGERSVSIQIVLKTRTVRWTFLSSDDDVIWVVTSYKVWRVLDRRRSSNSVVCKRTVTVLRDIRRQAKMACNSCEVVLQREQREAKQTLADVWSLCLNEVMKLSRWNGVKESPVMH